MVKIVGAPITIYTWVIIVEYPEYFDAIQNILDVIQNILDIIR